MKPDVEAELLGYLREGREGRDHVKEALGRLTDQMTAHADEDRRAFSIISERMSGLDSRVAKIEVRLDGVEKDADTGSHDLRLLEKSLADQKADELRAKYHALLTWVVRIALAIGLLALGMNMETIGKLLGM